MERLAVQQPGLSETRRLFLISVLTGVSAGLLVVLFHIAIDVVRWITIESDETLGLWNTLLFPPLGALAAVLLVRRVFRSAEGSGVNLTKAALYARDGDIPASAVVGKFVACVTSIGSGTSLGPEDPALQMGAGVASLIGKAFQLPRRFMRLVAPVGAAAGIGAAFNTPITAVLFVIEEVIGSWNASVLGSVVLGAVSSVATARAFLGDEPLFRVPPFSLKSSSELLIYALVGIAGGLLAEFFVRAATALRERFRHMQGWQRSLQPVVAGLATGLAGFWLPDVLGAGYAPVDSALHNQYPTHMLVWLCAVKLAATGLCFSAGIPGGMFAPTLFIGAMAGGAIGAAAHAFWPDSTSPPSAYVLVGMGTFFAGVFRAPMTSIFMVFEVSRSYVIILPVMIANTLSYLISRYLQPEPFFDIVARQDGLWLPSVEELREAPPLRVEDVMSSELPPVVPADLSLSHALSRLDESRSEYAFSAIGQDRWFLLRRSELQKVLNPAAEVALKESNLLQPVSALHPDQSLETALLVLRTQPLVPVVDRLSPDVLIGVVTQEAVDRLAQTFAGGWRDGLHSQLPS